MHLVKAAGAVIIGSFFVVLLVVAAIRKVTYQLYSWFPNAERVCEFGRKRKFDFYWVNRADYSRFHLVRLYTLWMMLRLDKYLHIINCDRQASKAQYFHTSGRYAGMSGWRFRDVNPESWPVLFMRRFVVFLFPSLSRECNQAIDKPKYQAAAEKAGSECSP